MMNHTFRDMIDLGLLADMDDLLIYAKTVEEHDEIVREVLRRLQKINELAVSPEKYAWRVTKVEFLGYIIGSDGFANFYRCFIRDYSRVARPLTELTKSNAKDWNGRRKLSSTSMNSKLGLPPPQFWRTLTPSSW
jgi:hypothetical protein